MNLSETEVILSDEVKRKLALPIVKIDMGCGLNRHEKEMNEYIYIDGDSADGIDIVCDFFEGVPLPNCVADVFHASELIEHFPLWKRDGALREWNRVMKLDCVCHITTPNLEFVIRSANDKTKDAFWIMQNLYGNQDGSYYHQHYTLYTKQTLVELLDRYGFGEIVVEDAWGAGNDSTKLEWLSCKFKKIKNL